ncbi:hypothetical protein ACHWQZ_G006043 [Mnemiopsis leidyi]
MFWVLLLSFIGTGAASNLPGYCTLYKGEIEILKRPPRKVEVNLGDTVSLVCAAHGNGMADPYVYWIKGLGPGFEEKGKHMGPVAVGKSTLFIEKVTEEDIDTYRCVVKDCCTNKKEEMDVDVLVPDETCKDVYGVGAVLYGATWEFKNWTAAVQACKDKGLQIAFPKNKDENAQLLHDIKASFITHPNAKKYAHENWVWIGGHDSHEEGQWKEIKTNELITWFNWEWSQPDNWTKGNQHQEGQDCIGIRRTNGKWDDSFIHHERPYVCECPDKKLKN